MSQKESEWEKNFIEQFVDDEGCEAGHETQPDCPYCKRWGGASGEPKWNKRPRGTSEEIKQFISKALSTREKEIVKEIEKMALDKVGDSEATRKQILSILKHQ